MKKIANLFLVFLLLGSDILLAADAATKDTAAVNTSDANKTEPPPQGGEHGYTNAETGNVQAVMDGNLELFVEAYLRSLQKIK